MKLLAKLTRVTESLPGVVSASRPDKLSRSPKVKSYSLRFGALGLESGTIDVTVRPIEPRASLKKTGAATLGWPHQFFVENSRPAAADRETGLVVYWLKLEFLATD